jgi:hypothetical protein
MHAYFIIHILFGIVVKEKIKIVGNRGCEFELPSSRSTYMYSCHPERIRTPVLQKEVRLL